MPSILDCFQLRWMIIQAFSQDDGCQEGNTLQLFSVFIFGVVLRNMIKTILLNIKYINIKDDTLKF